MRNLAALLVASAFFTSSHSTASAGQDVTAALITRTIEVGQPIAPCEAADVVGVIARTTGVPAGVEFIPGDCGYRHTERSTTRQALQGLAIREALDRIVEWDPRYRWRLLDGVISFRPVDAWDRPDHFLHTTTGALQLADVNIGEAFVAISRILGVRHVSAPVPRTPLAEKQFSVAPGDTSVVAALDAVVRAHGEMWWEVRYCKPEPLRQYATVFLRTFDNAGLGVRVDQSFRSRKAIDPCAHDIG
jgi:hypothetical protein